MDNKQADEEVSKVKIYRVCNDEFHFWEAGNYYTTKEKAMQSIHDNDEDWEVESDGVWVLNYTTSEYYCDWYVVEIEVKG